jgi:hypothetical protein
VGVWGAASPPKVLPFMYEKAFIIKGQGRLSPLWVWAKPKVLPFLLNLCIKKRGVWGCKPSQGFAFYANVKWIRQYIWMSSRNSARNRGLTGYLKKYSDLRKD